MHPPKFNTW